MRISIGGHLLDFGLTVATNEGSTGILDIHLVDISELSIRRFLGVLSTLSLGSLCLSQIRLSDEVVLSGVLLFWLVGQDIEEVDIVEEIEVLKSDGVSSTRLKLHKVALDGVLAHFTVSEVLQIFFNSWCISMPRNMRVVHHSFIFFILKILIKY